MRFATPVGSWRRSTVAAFIALIVAAATPAAAAEPPIIVKRQTAAGQEVHIRGFAQFDANCALIRVQTVKVAEPPQHGRVETRPGPVVIGKNWVGGTHCEGTTLPGVNTFYVPAGGFTGTDRFALEVVYSARRIVRAEVEVEVR